MRRNDGGPQTYNSIQFPIIYQSKHNKIESSLHKSSQKHDLLRVTHWLMNRITWDDEWKCQSSSYCRLCENIINIIKFILKLPCVAKTIFFQIIRKQEKSPYLRNSINTKKTSVLVVCVKSHHTFCYFINANPLC